MFDMWLIQIEKYELQVLELLHGDFSCLKYMKKSRIPFFRKAFCEELKSMESE